MLSVSSACVKSYDGQIKLMYFWIEDDKLSNKYNTLWDKKECSDIKKIIENQNKSYDDRNAAF